MATTASLASPVAARAARHAICAAAAAPPRAPAAAPRSCRRAVPCRGAALVTRAEAAVGRCGRRAVPRRGAALVTRAEAAVAGAVTPVDVTLEEFNAMVAEEPAVLVDFYTTWCGPCKVLDLALKKLAPTYGDRCKFVKVDAEKSYAVAKEHAVKKLPTLLLFSGGKLIERWEGVLSAQDLDLRLLGALSNNK